MFQSVVPKDMQLADCCGNEPLPLACCPPPKPCCAPAYGPCCPAAPVCCRKPCCKGRRIELPPEAELLPPPQFTPPVTSLSVVRVRLEIRKLSETEKYLQF
ncbi:unnamed protein product [Gongylonema pulchrum]|uniref:GRANULINS domain-containing protein n=1 Tax=Gongylonema pulchrum TaxID=637853 RepID=A0A183EGD3_9BILA|nr:unnamed protein product [Gongylonema pulchrum]